MLARIGEAEECIESLTVKVVKQDDNRDDDDDDTDDDSKVNVTEKIRNRFTIDLEDLQMEHERINSAISVAEKKLKNFDLVK